MFSFEDLVSSVEGAISDVADAVSDAVDYVSDAVSDAVDYVSDVASDVSDDISDAGDHMLDAVDDVLDGNISDAVDDVSYAVDDVLEAAEDVSDAVLGATSAIADVCEDWASDAEEFFEENYKAVVGAFIEPVSSDSSGSTESFESIFDKIKNAAKDFTVGAGYSLDNNMFFGVTTHVAGMNDDNLPDSTSCKVGRLAGDIVSIIGSGAEIVGGAGGEIGGIALDATGVGAIAGVPINVGSVVLVSDGVVNGYRSATSLAGDLYSLMSRPPNLSPDGAGRNGAFREAKRKSEIPVTEQPQKVTPAVDKRGNRIPGKDYDFGDGKVIRDHSGGHEFPDDPSQNRGPHFNDSKGNHYDYPAKER